MIKLQNTAAGGTNSTAASTSNTGGASGNPATGVPIGTGTVTFSNAESFHSAGLSYLCAVAGSSTTAQFQWNSSVITSTPTTAFGQVAIYLTAYPTVATVEIVRFFTSGGTQLGAIGILTSGKLCTKNAAGTTVTTAASALPLNQWIRIDPKLISSATAGGVYADAFVNAPLTGTVADASYSAEDALTQNTNGGACQQVSYGICLSTTSFSYYIGQIGFSDTAPLGPPVAFTDQLGFDFLPIGAGQPLRTPTSSAIAIPGQTILGYYQSEGAYAPQKSFGTTISHPFKFGSFYCDMTTGGNGLGAGNQMALAAADGRASRISMNLELFSGVYPTNTRATVAPQNGASSPYQNSHPWWGFDDVLAGGLDAVIDQYGDAIAAVAPVMVTVDVQHEPDLSESLTNPKTAPNLFAPMVRYVYNRLIKRCSNFEMAWCVSGTITGSSSTVCGTLTAAQLYALLWGIPTNGYTPAGGPVDDFITWVCWDPYITAISNVISKLLNFKTLFIDTGVLGTAIQSKYYMLGEWGIGQGSITTADRATYFGQVAAALQPLLDIIIYFDSNQSGAEHDFEVFNTTDGTISAFESMAASLA